MYKYASSQQDCTFSGHVNFTSSVALQISLIPVLASKKYNLDYSSDVDTA